MKKQIIIFSLLFLSLPSKANAEISLEIGPAFTYNSKSNFGSSGDIAGQATVGYKLNDKFSVILSDSFGGYYGGFLNQTTTGVRYYPWDVFFLELTAGLGVSKARNSNNMNLEPAFSLGLGWNVKVTENTFINFGFYTGSPINTRVQANFGIKM